MWDVSDEEGVILTWEIWEGWNGNLKCEKEKIVGNHKVNKIEFGLDVG